MASLNALWPIESQEYRAQNLDMGCCRCAVLTMHAFVGWHSVGIFALRRAMEHKPYVDAPDWWAPLEPLQVLLVLSAAVFA